MGQIRVWERHQDAQAAHKAGYANEVHLGVGAKDIETPPLVILRRSIDGKITLHFSAKKGVSPTAAKHLMEVVSRANVISIAWRRSQGGRVVGRPPHA